jgi:hypothetical protein
MTPPSKIPLPRAEPWRPPILDENEKLRELADSAETLLCNALPMAHCSQSEWDDIIHKWRDQKNAIRTAPTGETATPEASPSLVEQP